MSGENYQQFREKKHASFGTPLKIWQDVIWEHLRIKIVNAERLIIGESNEVYESISDKGQKLIVRISHSKSLELYREKWAMEAAFKVGVPTPKILLLIDISDTEHKRTLCVEEKIEGKILGDILESLPLEKKKMWVNKAGEMLARIHSVPPHGFGWLNGDGYGEYAQWSNYIEGEFLEKDKLLINSKKVGIDEKQVLLAFDVLKKHEPLYQNITPHLLHGDFGPKHLFVTGDQITGVIDMEHAISGDPANDFAWWDYFRGDKLPIQWLKDGYTDAKMLDDTFDMRMHLCELSLGLSLIQYYSENNNLLGLDHTKTRFFHELNYLKSK